MPPFRLSASGQDADVGDGDIFAGPAAPERELANAESRERELRLRQIVENADDLFWLHEVESGKVLYASPAYETIWGRPLASAYENPADWIEAVHPDDKERIQAGFENMLQGNPYDEEYRIRLADGTVRWIRDRGRPVLDPGGRVYRLAGISRDITDRKLAQQSQRVIEAQFKHLVSVASDWFWETDEDGCFVYISERFFEEFDVASDRIIGKTREEWISHQELESDPGKWRRHFEDIAARRPFRNLEYAIEGNDGSVRHISVSGDPILDEDGTFRGYRGADSDITERKRAEAALRESEEKFRAVVDHSPVSIVLKDTEGRYLIANRQWKSWFNISGDEYLNKTIFDFVPREQAEQIDAHDRRALEDPAPEDKEFSIPYPDGVTRDILSQKFLIMGADGLPTAVGTVITDITELKRAEVALRQAKEAAEYANRAKTEFLANMSHELRTPLNSIIGFSDLLKDGVFGSMDNPKYEGYAEDINKSGIHLLELITDILDISRIEIGELDLDEVEVDIGETVETCMMMVRERSHRAKVSLTSEMPDGLPRLHADQRRVKQILLNLLTNAVKFTPAEGSVVLEAGLDEGGGIVLAIRDSGIGIAPEKIPEVLVPFGQGGNVMTRPHEGTGLGLSLAKSLAEMHGGTLSIDSRLGKGTTVTVSFPGHRTVASG